MLNDVFRFKIPSELEVLLKQVFVHFLSKSFFFWDKNLRWLNNFRFLCHFRVFIKSYQLRRLFGLSSSLNHMIDYIGSSFCVWSRRDIFFRNCILGLQLLLLLFFFVQLRLIPFFISQNKRLSLSVRKNVGLVLKVQVANKCIE